MLKHIADEIRRLPDCDFHRGVTSLARALGAAYLQGLFLPAQPINILQTLNKIYFLNKLLDMPHCADVKGTALMECCHSILLSILCDTPGKRNPFRGFSPSSNTHPQAVSALLQP